MGAKVSFDAGSRDIVVTQAPVNGVITLDVQVDLYSDGKEDWLVTPSLQVARFPIRPIGGDQVPGRVIGDSYVLENGWKIVPYEADHELVIEGNLFTEVPPLVADTVGDYRVRVESVVSTLVEIRTDTTSQDALTRLLDGTFGQKLVQWSTDAEGGTPGYLVMWEEDGLTLLGHKEIYETKDDPTQPGVTVGYRGRGIGWEGPLVAGMPP